MKGKKIPKTVKKAAKKSVPGKRSLNALMKDEDGFVSKENILKIGLTTVASLGVVGMLTDQAHATYTHTNNTVAGTGYPSCGSHTNHNNFTY